jgi:hypothetical protein
MYMPFIISLCLSLLTLSAGMLLLAKTKNGLGRFFKVMSWVIIGCGMLLTLMSIQMAAFKCISRWNHSSGEKEDVMFFHGPKGPCGPACFKGCCGEDMEEGEGGFFGDEPCSKKMMFCRKFAGDEDEGEQTEAIIKVISDSTKLTADQEKKIKDAVDRILKEIK